MLYSSRHVPTPTLASSVGVGVSDIEQESRYRGVGIDGHDGVADSRY